MLEDALALLKAWQGPLTLLTFFLGPTLFRKIIHLSRPTKLHSPPSAAPAKLILLAQLLYTTYTLTYPSYDLFTSHSRKITTPTNELRTLISAAAGLQPTSDSTGNALIDLLLVRLSTLPPRLQYARWGHDVFLKCVWCRSTSDFALASMPSILGPYVAEAIIIGTLGWRWVSGQGARARGKYRSAAGWIVLAAALAEYGARSYWEIWVADGDCLHLAPVVVKVRSVLLLLVTAGYVLLPVRPTQQMEVEMELMRVLDQTYTTLNLTNSARSAIARSGELEKLSQEHQRESARNMEQARRGEQLDPEARENSRRFVRAKWESVVRHL